MGNCWPQVDGAVTSGPDLSVEVNGLKLPNPFVIGSGAPHRHWLPVPFSSLADEMRASSSSHCEQSCRR